MKRIHIVMLVLIVLPLVVPSPGKAIPAFARKYGFNCMMCHTAYPKLNDWGQRFRDNGYQLPGQEGKEKNVFDAPTPIALRSSTGFNAYSVKRHTDEGWTTTAGFDLGGLDLLAAGVLHKNVSVLVIYTPRIDEPTANFWKYSAESQPGALESASIIFSNIIPDALNVRVGRFEPAYHMMSSKRSYYLQESYEIYGFSTPHNDYLFDDNQIGVEATGHFRMGFKYGAGIVNGTGAYPDNNTFKDMYLTLSQVIGAGEGQSAGQRIGGFIYYGKVPTSPAWPYSASPTGEGAGTDNEQFMRYGGSASLNWRTFNLAGMYVGGMDDKRLNILAHPDNYYYNGTFVELDYAGLMNNRLVASALYNWVKPPDYDDSGTINAYSALVRYYFGDWTAVNVALHGEYTYRKTVSGDNTATENMYSLLVDFGF